MYCLYNLQSPPCTQPFLKEPLPYPRRTGDGFAQEKALDNIEAMPTVVTEPVVPLRGSKLARASPRVVR